MNSRPGTACAVAFSSQITESTFGEKCYKLLNRIIKHLRATKDVCLQFPKLDLESLQLSFYSDASFNNKDDHSSQLGYVILLMDGTGSCCVL